VDKALQSSSQNTAETMGPVRGTHMHIMVLATQGRGWQTAP
jgi:hypothetical protein